MTAPDLTAPDLTAPDRMAARLTLPFQRGADRLPLTLIADPDLPERASVAPYDFGEHLARFDALPEPRYLVTALRDVPAAVTLSLAGTDAGGAARTVTATIPAGTLAGTSVLLDLGDLDRPGARLTRLTMTPAPPPGSPVAARRWDVRALLGELGRLLWVVGGGRDELRAHTDQVRRLTRLPEATGLALDLIGYDLTVPRFPPLPYAFEDGTIALYHCDEPSSGSTVADIMPLYGGTGHPGTVTAARTGAVGRFDRGVAFGTPAAEVTIADHADFAFGTATSFTAECFVQPADGAWEGALLSKHPDPALTAGKRGWAISVGGFGRGLPRNVRFLVSDGATTVPLFADLTLPAERFSHLAGVVDRAAGQARLYVDGVLRASRPLGALGTLTTDVPLRIGRAAASAAATFQGTVDEVRLSRAARTRFHPVLGEGDDGYRRRLRLFQRWRLPTPANLTEALNDAVGTVRGVDRPLVVEDADATLAAGGAALRVLPETLAAGESIDDLGQRGTSEAEVNGVPGDDPDFDPDLLVDATDPRVVFTPSADAPTPHRMRAGTRRALWALLDLIEATGQPGQLHVIRGYRADPADAATELYAVGRKLAFVHLSLPPGRLAALAHRAGFTWVRASVVVVASVRSTETLEIEVGQDPQDGFDVLTGQTLAVTVTPALPLRAQIRWYVISAGVGRAAFAGRTDRASAALTAQQPGELVVGVRVMIGTRSFRATRRLRAGIAALAAGQSIAATGELGADPAVAGRPGADFFAPAYLDTVQDARVEFAAGANRRRMAPVLSGRLARLLDLIAAAGDTGKPRVASAWLPTGTGLEIEGRALSLERGTLTMTLDRLGALAHAAGFSHVASDGSRLRILQAAGDPVRVTGDPEPSEGGTVELQLRPAARPEAAVLAGGVLYTANTGTDSVSAIDPATGRVIRVLKVGVGPVALAAGPDGRLYCAERDGLTVSRLDPTTGTVQGSIGFSPSARPIDLVCHPSQPRLYVACLDGSVLQFNTDTLASLGLVNVGASITALDIHPDGTRLWVATGDARVRVVNTATFAIAATVTLTGTPRDIVVGATAAYATVPDQNALVVLAVSAPAVQATFTDLGPDPLRLALRPDGQLLYVTDAGQTRVHLRRPDGSAQPPAQFPPQLSADRAPAAIAVDGGQAYLVGARNGLGDEGAISVLDAEVSTGPVDVWPLGTGHGERLTWSVRGPAAAGARLSSSTRQRVDLTSRAAGPLQVQAMYRWPDHTPPYAFTVRLSPALEALETAGTEVVIRKDQYDLIMNVLSELHPVGVEVDTRVIREHVVEIRESLLDVFPGHTFPDFRTRGPRPPIPNPPQP
ncbi:LamG-like jellyroll fold domain-containing protein [Actinomycetes bacterium KLBMP 9797]